MLSDKEILMELSTGSIKIRPFEFNRLGPVSYDLEIGSICTPRGECKNEVLLLPGEFIGVTSKETITLVSDKRISGLFSMRSGPTREGLFGSFSSLLDPGYSGKLNLVLTSVKPIKIKIGDSITQVMFFKTGEVLKPWKGKGKNFGGKV